jgi:heat shock protein HtpX
MTLLQGVINTFVIFLSYVLAHLVTAMFRKDRQKDSDTFVFYILRQVFQILFMIVGSLIICSYSRYREYKADLGGAKLSSFDKMIRALKRLDTISTRKEEQSPQSLAALMFTQKTSAQELFSTHPTLEKRIAALQAAAV